MLQWIRDFKVMLHDTVFSNKTMPAKAVAEKLGLEYPNLSRQVNPDDTGARFDAAYVAPLLHITQDFRLLHFQAACLNYRARPLGALVASEQTPLQRHVSLDAAVTLFKRLDASGERYETLIAAMSEIADAAETICTLARARDFGQSREEAMIGRAMFKRERGEL
jgi:hypothetical protein